jgi:hypothetical protein
MKMPGFEGRIGSRTCNKVSSRQARTDSRSKTCHRLAGSRAGPATMDEGCFWRPLITPTSDGNGLHDWTFNGLAFCPYASKAR